MNENNYNQKFLRVAIIYTSDQKPDELGNSLKAHNIEIVAMAELSNQALWEIDTDSTDAILVDLDENAEQELEVLENLLEVSSLPLLFNDSETTQFNLAISKVDWSSKLALKLRTLVEKFPKKKSAPMIKSSTSKELPNITQIIPAPTVVHAPKETSTPAPISTLQKQLINRGNNGAEQVWVLGASLGGPLAVREFLSRLPENLPIAFVLAQHIGASHIKLLSEQLDRVTPLNVKIAKAGHVLSNSEVVLAPIEERIIINNEAKIMLSPVVNQSIYSPSIDEIMVDIAEIYQTSSGAIIFSGMGNDGEEGSKAMSKFGGVIWAQEAESCTISSMPDCARRAGCVSHSNTPVGLADDLVEYLAQI